jgi:hypothetical protein
LSALARRALALALAMIFLGGPLVPVARAATGGGAVILENRGLQRTNQVLSVLLALLKLIDEIGQLDPGAGTPMPPPSGTGHPGPMPGPLPVTTPGDEFALGEGT